MAKLEDVDGWIRYLEFRFSKKVERAPQAFYVSILPEVDALADQWKDSPGPALWRAKWRNANCWVCWLFLDGTTGTRYRIFQGEGLREHFDPAKARALAPAMVKRYRKAYLDDPAYGGYAGSKQGGLFWGFATLFPDAPNEDLLKKTLAADFDTVPPADLASRSARIARHHGQPGRPYRAALSVRRRRSTSCCRCLPCPTARRLHPGEHRAWLDGMRERYVARAEKLYEKRWKRYEYRSFRYPKVGEEIEYRGAGVHTRPQGRSRRTGRPRLDLSRRAMDHRDRRLQRQSP